MKKRMALDEIWKQCLKMWRWIVRQPCPRDIGKLKREWLRKHGFNDIFCDCFFCDAVKENKSRCLQCPGKKVDKSFDCNNDDYYYYEKHAAFLRKITELDKIRNDLV